MFQKYNYCIGDKTPNAMANMTETVFLQGGGSEIASLRLNLKIVHLNTGVGDSQNI